MEAIVDSIITNKMAKSYLHDIKFYENWCNITLYSKESRIQKLLELMARYSRTTTIIESVIIGALSDNIKSIHGGLERNSIFKNLYLPKKSTIIEYEFILLLYALVNFHKISAFIKYNTTIMKDRHQFAVILGVDDRLAQKAEITITVLDLMSYKGGKLKIAHELMIY